jgi:hypothetical protein
MEFNIADFLLLIELISTFPLVKHSFIQSFDLQLIYPVNIHLGNTNPFIWEGGLGIKLGPIFANGAVSYAQFYTFAIGAGLSF